MILAASGSSKCYEKYSSLSNSLPYRDFYYNVAYESISYAARILGAQKISMSHLSASGQFHKDIATCVAEALAHFCDRIESPIIKQFLFFGCCMNESHFLGLERLNSEGKISKHHNITITTSLVDEFEVISLKWWKRLDNYVRRSFLKIGLAVGTGRLIFLLYSFKKLLINNFAYC